MSFGVNGQNYSRHGLELIRRHPIPDFIYNFQPSWTSLRQACKEQLQTSALSRTQVFLGVLGIIAFVGILLSGPSLTPPTFPSVYLFSVSVLTAMVGSVALVDLYHSVKIRALGLAHLQN